MLASVAQLSYCAQLRNHNNPLTSQSGLPRGIAALAVTRKPWG